MLRPRFLLLCALFLQFSYKVHAMTCNLPLGIELTCPTFLNDEDKVFCCNASNNVPYCCDFGEYIRNNSAVLAGILIGALIILIIITLCCCCFCSCCLLAKRRSQRGTIIYAPVSNMRTIPSTSPAVSSSAYPSQPGFIVHSSPASSQYPPPYPQDIHQPPVNPGYKY